ncbi:hypothetical protein VP01_941g2 [Puccinia sorghi]|uniref:Uncharacterized protein n=1 Tax=Puccinia sorghi TaxID=27349 RepID=A0A0L6U752_9BASI|nr:hypothetical protein VP01_941g2 [Puccinia sorghi]
MSFAGNISNAPNYCFQFYHKQCHHPCCKANRGKNFECGWTHSSDHSSAQPVYSIRDINRPLSNLSLCILTPNPGSSHSHVSMLGKHHSHLLCYGHYESSLPCQHFWSPLFIPHTSCHALLVLLGICSVTYCQNSNLSTLSCSLSSLFPILIAHNLYSIFHTCPFSPYPSPSPVTVPAPVPSTCSCSCPQYLFLFLLPVLLCLCPLSRPPLDLGRGLSSFHYLTVFFINHPSKKTSPPSSSFTFVVTYSNYNTYHCVTHHLSLKFPCFLAAGSTNLSQLFIVAHICFVKGKKQRWKQYQPGNKTFNLTVVKSRLRIPFLMMDRKIKELMLAKTVPDMQECCQGTLSYTDPIMMLQCHIPPCDGLVP